MIKQILLPIICFVFVGYGQSPSYINIEDLGAIANSNDYAEQNTDVIKQAIKLINKKTTYAGIYIPKGTFYVNELLEGDGIDFRYVNWQGAGKRHSIIKLANGRNKPIIETAMYFESHIRDIQFNGNAENNPKSEYTVIFRTANCYTVELNNVYFRDHTKVGLFLDRVVHFTLDNFDAKYGGVGGLKAFNCLGIVTTNTDIEQNKDYAMLFESHPDSGKYRYKQPLIELNNPYCESNGVGILLKGICNVRVKGGYNHGGVFAKITSNDDKTAFSHYNFFDGNQIGQIIIDKGNYGNVVVPSFTPVIDLDGRNIDFINGKSKEYLDPKNLKFSTNNFHEVSEKKDNVKILSKSKNSSTVANILIENNVSYVYLKLKGDLNSYVAIRVYDLSLKKWYNFSTEEIQENHRDFNTEFRTFTNGGLQYLKIPLQLGAMKNPRLQIKLGSKSNEAAKIELYGYNIN